MTKSYDLSPDDRKSSMITFHDSGWVSITGAGGRHRLTLKEDEARAILVRLQRHFLLDALTNT